MSVSGLDDDWDFYPLLVDSEPASIFLNLGFARIAPVEKYAQMTYLRLYMRQPREDGLSSQEEYETLCAVDDALTDAIAAKGKSLYVGRNTSSGNRDFYFYTRDAKRFEKVAAKAMAAFPQYEFDIGVRDDGDWSTYFEFLYPSPRDMQRIQNRRVCHNLMQHGDNLDAPRKIDHFAYFPTREAAEAFRDYALKKGFAADEAQSNDGQFSVEFSREDPPASIDDFQLELREKVIEMGGDYDGWGCPIVAKGDDA